jgi:3-oxoacyl-[acyl-carrier-protein] synthase II
MYLTGLGTIFAGGRGVDALAQSLTAGWRPPEMRAVPGRASPFPVYAVPATALEDKVTLGKARRADRFTRLALLAAADAWQDSGQASRTPPDRLGVVVATGLGPHATTFGFLDGILDFGEAAASPTSFSHSVHNAAAAYIATTLNVRGPTLSLTHFHFAFHEAIQTASCWLAEDRCDTVLVVAVDEGGAVLEHVCSRLLVPAADGRIQPFACAAPPVSVPGEGGVCLVLTRNPGPNVYAQIASSGEHAHPIIGGAGSLLLLDACGLATDERAYRAAVPAGARVASYTPLLGSSFLASAFHAAVSALMLKRQTCYACPVAVNPHGFRICEQTASAPLREIACIRLDCAGAARTIRLVKCDQRLVNSNQ